MEATSISEANGRLQAFDLGQLPFIAVRAFLVDSVPVGSERGGHGHRTGHQWLQVTRGRVELRVIGPDGETRFELPAGGPGFHLRPNIIAWQRYLEPDTQLLVFASNPYEPGDYLSEAPEAQM